jgi:ELWxxDGT repeat protein
MIRNVPSRTIAVSQAAKDIVRAFILCLLFFLISGTAVSQIQLLKDVNTREETGYNEYSYPVFTKAGSYFYYVSKQELWRSDGTLAGTIKLRSFADVKSVTAIGSTVYFAANDGSTGMEVWKSNGTVAGTVLVKDIYAGTGGSTPSNFTLVNTTVYFTARNATSGLELWKTNGTAAGTVLVKDIISGSGSSNPGYLCGLNGTLLFVANNGQIGYELWRSDGTAAGTVVVKDIRPAAKVSSLPQYLTNVNGVVYFGAIDDTGGRELWKTNGTNAGTVRVKDIRPGTTGSNVENLVNLNGMLVFTADDGVVGDELWKSDGTAAGTVLVKDMNPGAAGSNNEYDGGGSPGPDMANFKVINGLLYFTAAKGYTNYIYRTNGTAAGTVIIAEAPWSDFGGTLYPMPHFTYMNGYVYFFNAQWVENEGYYALHLFKMPYNGTSPTVIKRFADDITLGMISHNSALFIVGKLVWTRGWMLIKSDGTAAGTGEFKDNARASMGSNPAEMFNHNGFVYFRANNSGFLGGAQEVWRTNGTTEGTIKLGVTNDRFPWKAAGSYVYFVSGTDSPYKWRLYRTNGTTTVLVKEGGIEGEYYDYTMPKEMVDVSGKLYFSTRNGELWRYDPTTSSIKLLKTFYGIKNLYGANGRAYVVATDGSITSLYRADATGAYQIEMLSYTSQDRQAAYYPSVLFGSVFYFMAQDETHGNEIWRTDGTAAGTYMVQDMSTYDYVGEYGPEYSAKRLFIHNNALYATAIDSERDTYLWKFNGSVFVKVKEIYDYNLVSHNGLIYIWGRDVTDWNGNVLQVTDGTAEGFQTLAEFPRSTNDEYVEYGIVGNMVYFNTNYSDDFWRTDGTSCGTIPVGSGKHYVYSLQGLGTSLIFGAEAPLTGVEPHIYRNINSMVTDNCAESIAMSATSSEEQASIMTAYPNPYTQEFTLRLEGEESEEAEVAVYSSTGMPIETFKGVKMNTDYEHIGTTWPKGIYLVKVNKGGELSNFTVIKK